MVEMNTVTSRDTDRDQRHRWALAELDRAMPDTESRVRQAVVALLSTWNRMAAIGLSTEDERTEALEAFRLLCSGERLPEPDGSAAVPRVWGPADLYYNVAPVLRTRTDLVQGADGWRVNGREGTLVGVRGGYFIVRFTEELDGGPQEYRGRPTDFEADVTDL